MASQHSNRHDGGGRAEAQPDTAAAGGGTGARRRGTLAAVVACVLYMLTGPALIVTNRHIMKEFDFAFPSALSSLGQLSSALVAWTLVHVTKTIKLEHRHRITWRFYCMRILPVGLFTAITFRCGNAVYLHLSVSLIQMLKAFTPAVVLALSMAFGLSRPTRQLRVATLTICLGVALSSWGAIEADGTGLVLMFAAEVFEALRLVFTQMLLIGALGAKFGVMEGLYWMCPAVLINVCVLVIPFTELSAMIEGNALGIVAAHPAHFVAAMALGFLVNFCGFFVMQTSSALVLKLLGTLRNVGLIGFSIWQFGDFVTAEQVGGFLVSLCGFGWFQYLKMNGLADLKDAAGTGGAGTASGAGDVELGGQPKGVHDLRKGKYQRLDSAEDVDEVVQQMMEAEAKGAASNKQAGPAKKKKGGVLAEIAAVVM